MTDEERARALWNEKIGRRIKFMHDHLNGSHANLCIEDIAAAFAAIREECAKVVEEWHERNLVYVRDSGGYEPDADAIAQAIRTGP